MVPQRYPRSGRPPARLPRGQTGAIQGAEIFVIESRPLGDQREHNPEITRFSDVLLHLCFHFRRRQGPAIFPGPLGRQPGIAGQRRSRPRKKARPMAASPDRKLRSDVGRRDDLEVSSFRLDAATGGLAPGGNGGPGVGPLLHGPPTGAAATCCRPQLLYAGHAAVHALGATGR